MNPISRPLARLAFALSLPLAPAFVSAADSAASIIAGFEAKKAAALEAYLESQPGAPDSADALDSIVGSQLVLGDAAAAAGAFKRKLAALPEDASAQEVAMQLNELVDEIAASGNPDAKTVARDLIDSTRAAFEDNPQSGPLGQFLDQLAGGLNKPGIGDTLDIAFTSLQGGEVDLAEMKGKVILVDFWATWCGPCIGELPNVKEAYSKFHDKGFEIVAISLDQQQETLETFIEEKEMPWPQHFDGKGWGNEIATKFGIQSIPATFLVGKDGKIAAADLRGAALSQAVEEALAR